MKHNCLLSIYSTLVGMSRIFKTLILEPLPLAPLWLGTTVVSWEGNRNSWKLLLTARPTPLDSYCITNLSGPATFHVTRLLYYLLPRVINCQVLCQCMMYPLQKFLTTLFPETKYLPVSFLLPLCAAIYSAHRILFLPPYY